LVRLEWFKHMKPTVHTSVLLHESIDGLDIKANDIYLDGTLGGAGHALAALAKVKGKLTVIGLDRDGDALERCRKVLTEGKIILKQASFGDMDKILEEIKIPKVNRIMLDLGLSSDQFEISGRGFTFQKDEPLLMTFDRMPKEDDLTAAYIVNNWQEETIADVIFGYGGEKYARRIAKGIIMYRTKKKIETTHELVEIIKGAVPAVYRHGRLHPATRTFQALRIAVNDELGTLKQGLAKGFAHLEKGGRMAVISFHSLEDRIVKHFYKEKADNEEARLITKKPIEAGEAETIENPRSRSAKLRILEKLV
jgi:16S rRNA (cytosine1402-N4)-methyltransferase